MSIEHPEFEHMRSFVDADLSNALESLLLDNDFLRVAEGLYHAPSGVTLQQAFANVATTCDFKFTFIYPVVRDIIKKCTDGVSYEGVEKALKPSLIITNHRDIVMDPSFVNLALMDKGVEPTEIAIGDNLLAQPWVKTLVRVCGAFIVERGKKGVEVHKVLSSYIRHAITQRGRAIWIAQREGRAKNSDDRTQQSLLKMFALDGDGSFVDKLIDLNVAPATISYEYDPCDYLKAAELVNRSVNPNYTKKPGEDMMSMKTGIMGYKGRVHINYYGSIAAELKEIAKKYGRRNEQVDAVCALIDNCIFKGYKFYPVNYWAYNQYFKTNRFADRYTSQEASNIQQYFDERVRLANVETQYVPQLRELLLEMYANPLKNNLSVVE